MGFLKIFSGKSPEEHEQKGDSLFKISAAGDAKLEYEAALHKLENHIPTHLSFKTAMENLYKYTNDSDGIRHALMNAPDLYYEDALYFLVSCSAFTNYLTFKANRESIDLSQFP